MGTPDRSVEVVAFWRAAGPQRWFKKDAAFDLEFRQRFESLHHQAAGRSLDGWEATADGALALMILLDQFPRNVWRGTAHMLATDALARWFAARAVDRGDDMAIEPSLRLFFYLPFAHSERIEDQQRSLALHLALGQVHDARIHHDLIQRFGRFPHRNRMLGRETTAEEQAFLDTGGFAG